jgi:hypothetical protein
LQPLAELLLSDPSVCAHACRYAAVLLDKQQHLEAVQLYRNAGRHAKAAKLLVGWVACLHACMPACHSKTLGLLPLGRGR